MNDECRHLIREREKFQSRKRLYQPVSSLHLQTMAVYSHQTHLPHVKRYFHRSTRITAVAAALPPRDDFDFWSNAKVDKAIPEGREWTALMATDKQDIKTKLCLFISVFYWLANFECQTVSKWFEFIFCRILNLISRLSLFGRIPLLSCIHWVNR